jgi:serine/threonine-protein phosphatase 2B regulatory subunit
MGCGRSVPSGPQPAATVTPRVTCDTPTVKPDVLANDAEGLATPAAPQEEDRPTRPQIDLPEDLLDLLRDNFDKIAKSQTDDGEIDKREFLTYLGVQESLFTDRIFDLFDADRNGSISKDEFITALAILCENGPVEEKIRLSFKLWDMDNNEVITMDDLQRVMVSTAEDSSLLISPAQMQKLVNATFALADLDNNGDITLAEYRKLVDRYPNMISNMTLDILSRFQRMRGGTPQADE